MPSKSIHTLYSLPIALFAITLCGCQPQFETDNSEVDFASQGGRQILMPFYATDPSSMFFIDHVNRPNDRFYISVRYQRPNPADSTSSPIKYPTSYNAEANTGLGPLSDAFQRGPLGGSQVQSTFQISGYDVGVLMRSWDSPHPKHLPDCQPNCDGYQKHTVYEYRWSQPPPVFTAKDPQRALEIEADIEIKQFEKWSTFSNGEVKGEVVGQFAFVVFLYDPAGKLLQYVVMVYSNRPLTDPTEHLMLEIIGAGNNGHFVSSNFDRRREMKYVTVERNIPYGNMETTWSGKRNFKFHLTPDNIANAIRDLNGRGGQLHTDPYAYRLGLVGLNQEVYYEDNGDAWVMGSSYRNLSAREISVSKAVASEKRAAGVARGIASVDTGANPISGRMIIVGSVLLALISGIFLYRKFRA